MEQKGDGGILMALLHLLLSVLMPTTTTEPTGCYTKCVRLIKKKRAKNVKGSSYNGTVSSFSWVVGQVCQIFKLQAFDCSVKNKGKN